MNENKEYDTLVLSGGGIKGFYLLGAIQALMDMKKLNHIVNFVGTSVGSMICYLLIIGYTPIEIIVELYKNKSLEKLNHFNLANLTSGFGITSFTFINETLEKLTINKIGRVLTLQQLKDSFDKNLVCTTYNMTTCCTEYISCETYPEMPCLIALRMSCNIPVIFDRFQYMDCYYIDGGISDNFPIQKGESIGNNVIAVLSTVNENDLKDEPSDGIINYFVKLIQIPMIRLSKQSILNSRNNTKIISVNSNIVKNSIDFSVKSKFKLEMFSEGYTSAKNQLS